MPLLPFPETLVTAQVDGTALTAAARNSAIPAAALFTLPPNFFDVAGKTLHIKASGRISTVITTPGDARFDVNFLDSAAANAIVFDGLAVKLETVTAYTNHNWWLEIWLTCRAVGVTGNLFGQGLYTAVNVFENNALGALPRGSMTATLPFNTAPAVGANFNTTLAQQVDLRFTQTVATGSLTLHQYALIRMN
jgi:hypothetical protein